MNKAYEHYRWKWENYPQEKILESVPIHLDLELTSRCNYKCIFCFQALKEIPKIDIPLDLAKKVIIEFLKKGGSSIKFVYRGEPLMYKHLKDLILFSKEHGLIEAIVNTNGSMVSKKKAKELIESRLDLLVFSVDSSIPAIYEQLRRGGKLAIILKNIKYLQDLKKKLGKKKPIVRIQCINQELNKEEISSGKFEVFWRDLVDEIRINDICVDLKNTSKIGITKGFFCEGVYQRMTVRANGDICLCCGIDTDEKILGNVYIDSLEDVWHGDQFKTIRKHMDNGDAHLILSCSICDLRRIYYERNC